MFRAPERSRTAVALAAIGAAMLIAVPAIALVVQPTFGEHGYERTGDEQVLDVTDEAVAAAPVAVRDGFGSTPGPATIIRNLAAGATQYEWAKLVLYFGGWPETEDSVNTVVQWMRAENPVDHWWTRNNPLNNGWGTMEGNFLSGYATLVDAAASAAEAIHSLGGYTGIRAAFAGAVSNAESANAIWYSSWATGHYAYGAHWSTGTVPAVAAPPEAWGG